MLEPIAAADAVLTAAEKEMGVVLVDIGGGTTDIAIFCEGSVAHTIILPTGGIHITNDLAVGLRTPFQAAEEIKIKYGHANPNEVPETDLIDITAFGDEGTRTIYRREMADIIGARVDEICQMILNEIKRAGYERLLPAGVVLCGGTAELTGIRGFARGILQMPVRLGKPQHIEGFVDRVSTAAFATSVGLMQWGWQQQEHDSVADATPQPERSQRILQGLAVWARSLLPGH